MADYDILGFGTHGAKVCASHALAAVAVLVVAGCAGKTHPGSAPTSLVLTDTHGHVFETVHTDGTVSDGTGATVARYDEATDKLTLGALAPGSTAPTVSVKQAATVRDVHDVDVQLIAGMYKYHYSVSETGSLSSVALASNGTPIAGTAATVGSLNGYEASPQGAHQLAVLLCALPVVEPPRSPMTLVDDEGRLLAKITPEGTITDHAGRTLATFDRKTDKITLNLDSDVPSYDRIVDLFAKVGVGSGEITMGERFYPGNELLPAQRIRVADDGRVSVQGLGSDTSADPNASWESAGHLKDYYASPDALRQVAAVLYALPLAEPVDPSARLPIERPPSRPPPPPPPRK